MRYRKAIRTEDGLRGVSADYVGSLYLMQSIKAGIDFGNGKASSSLPVSIES